MLTATRTLNELKARNLAKHYFATGSIVDTEEDAIKVLTGTPVYK